MTETLQIEESIIGALINRSDLLKTASECYLSAKSFKEPFCRELFEEMLVQKSFDYNTLVMKFPERKEKIVQYMTSFTHAVHFRDWCAALKEDEIRNRMKLFFQKAIDSVSNDMPIDSIEQSVQKMIRSIDTELHNGKAKTTDELAKKGMEEILNPGNKVPFFSEGSSARSKVILKEKQIFIIAADSGTGKTEFCLSAAVIPCINAGKRVLYICTESQDTEIWNRLIGNYCGVPYRFIACKDKEKLGFDEVNRFSECSAEKKKEWRDRLIIRGSESGINRISDVRRVIHQAEDTGKIDLVVLDYIQNLRSDNTKLDGDIFNTVGDIMKDLKEVTDTYHFGLIICSQLNRTNDKVKSRPNIYRLKGSGDLEHTAHVVAFLWRDQNERTWLFSEKTRLCEPFEFMLTFDRYGYSVNDHKFK